MDRNDIRRGFAELLNNKGTHKTVELYPHNQETYNKIVNRFSNNCGYEGCRTCIVQPTGSGKSYIFMKWIEDNKSDKFIYLSPSTEIFEQLRIEADKIDVSMLNNVIFLTYTKLTKMSASEIEGLYADKIIIDEFHRTGAEEWGKALLKLLECNRQAQVLGATATPVRYLDDGKDMIDELFNGDIVNYMTLGEAVVRGILPKFKYIPVYYDLNNDMLTRYQEKIECGTYNRDKELDDKINRIKKNLQKAFNVHEVFKKNIKTCNGRYIVFCRNIEHLREVKEVIPSWFKYINSKVNVYTSTTYDYDKDSQYSLFSKDFSTDTVKLLLVIDRLNEGIHPKDIDGIIMLRPTTSPIIYLQQIGRALASGSNSPIIFDFVNNFRNVRTIERSGGGNILEVEIDTSIREFGVRENIDNSVEFRLFERVYEYMELLEELDAILSTSQESRWMWNFNNVKEYIVCNGNLPDSDVVFKGTHLKSWIQRQKHLYIKGSLDTSRVDLLYSIGIDVSINMYDESWDANYELFKEFINSFGSVPSNDTIYKNYPIGAWFRRQRIAYQKGTLNTRRLNLILSINPTFGSDYYERIWWDTYNLVEEYISLYSKSPEYKTSYKNVSIGSWFFRQLKAYNNGELSPDKVEALCKLGVDLTAPRSYTDMWNEKYDLLCVFLEENGRFPKSSEVFKGVLLGKWFANQKAAYKRGGMSSKKMELLQSIGIDKAFGVDYRKSLYNSCVEFDMECDNDILE